MTNFGRPRTGLPACKYCASTDRDSNGQCHCRNVLYRLIARYRENAAQITSDFNKALSKGKPVPEARDAVSAAPKAARSKIVVVKEEGDPYPPKVSQPEPAADPVRPEDFEWDDAERVAEHAADKDDEGHFCTCGFRGKGSAHSIRAHVAREKRLAREAGLL